MYMCVCGSPSLLWQALHISNIASSMAGVVTPPQLTGKLTFNGPPRSHPPAASFSTGPIMASTVQTSTYWASIYDSVQAHLRQAIPARSPRVVFEPMRNLALNYAPENMVSTLCVAACELVGGHREDAVALASALHLIHAASYTHEHLNLSGRPVSQALGRSHMYGPNIELLTGDGIASLGFELLARSSNDTLRGNSDRILRAVVEVARVAGSQGIMEGQYEETQFGERNEDVGRWIEGVGKRKEGRLWACGAACGEIIGGGSEEEIERLRTLGLHAGTIRAMLSRDSRKTTTSSRDGELVKGLKDLGLEELRDFDGAMAGIFSSLLEEVILMST